MSTNNLTAHLTALSQYTVFFLFLNLCSKRRSSSERSTSDTEPVAQAYVEAAMVVHCC